MWLKIIFKDLLEEIDKEEEQAFHNNEQVDRICSEEAKNCVDAGSAAKSPPITIATSLDELIINSVRARPPLWNHDFVKKFPSQTLELWEQVCIEVGQPISKRDSIKTMWSSLRSKFMKAWSVALKPRKSGDAARKRKTSGFVFYEQMLFLAYAIDIPV